MLRKVCFIVLSFALALYALTPTSYAQGPKSRHFTFDYFFTVRITDPGKTLDVWFPVAHTDQYQVVKIVSSTGDLPLRETVEREYGNRMLYAHADKATRAEYHFSVKYEWFAWNTLPPPRSARRQILLN